MKYVVGADRMKSGYEFKIEESTEGTYTFTRKELMELVEGGSWLAEQVVKKIEQEEDLKKIRRRIEDRIRKNKIDLVYIALAIKELG